MNRREALGALASASLAMAAPSGDMVYREFGQTGIKVSAIGLGGSHIGNPEEKEGIRIVRTAIDRGITFMDNCWDYHDGKSEVVDGQGAAGRLPAEGFPDDEVRRPHESRDSEADRRIAEAAADGPYRPDAVSRKHPLEDPDRFFAPSGRTKRLLEAKKAGKIRFIGFTGHKDPAVHLRMLEVAAQHNFHFDSAQMPLNLLDAQFPQLRARRGSETGGAGDRGARHEAAGGRRNSAQRRCERRSIACTTRSACRRR